MERSNRLGVRILLGAVGLSLIALAFVGPFAIFLAPLLWPLAAWLLWLAVTRR